MKLTLSPQAHTGEKLILFIMAFLSAPLVASCYFFFSTSFLGIEANEPFKYILLALSTLMMILIWWCVYTPPITTN